MRNKQPDTVNKPLENIVVSGFRIVDLDLLLFYKVLKTPFWDNLKTDR